MRSFIAHTVLTLALLGSAAHAAVLEVGSGKPFATLTMAVTAAASGDEIAVYPNGLSSGVSCTSLYSGEAMDATGKTLWIHPAKGAGNICVVGIGSAPLIILDNSGANVVEGFAMWINGAAPAFEVRRAEVYISDMKSIGASSSTAISGKWDAEIYVQRSWINDSRVAIGLNHIARATAVDNTISYNDLVLRQERRSECVMTGNDVKANGGVALVMGRAFTDAADNRFSNNDRGATLAHRSTSVFANNLWVENGLDDGDRCLLFLDRAQGNVTLNTFDKNVVGAVIENRGAGLVEIADSNITNSPWVGVICGSSGPTGIIHTNLWNVSTPTSGCSMLSMLMSADPRYATGALGAHYLDPAASPLVDAGSIGASSVFPTGNRTTDPSGVNPDVGVIDIGFHYPL